MGRRAANTTTVRALCCLILGTGGLALAGATSGCDLADGLQEVGGSLANPDAALLDTPGRRLASGTYYRLLVDGSLDDGGHVIALRSDRGKAEAAIIPYLEGSSCNLEPAIGFERLSSRIDVELPGILSIQRAGDEGGRGTISFVDFNCKEVFEDLPQSTLPQIAFPANDPDGLLALTAEGGLYLVNAVEQRLDLIAENVSIARTALDKLWTIEDGELVSRDSKFVELQRMGTAVTEFVLPGGGAIAVAFMDESGLNVYSEEDGVVHLSDTACSPVAWGLDAIGYLDPCDSARLHGYTLGSHLGSDTKFIHIEGPDGVTELERALVFWGLGVNATEILFLSAGDEGNTLMLGTIPTEAEESDGVVSLDTMILSEDSASIRSGLLYTDWNGISGTLVEQERDDERKTIGLKPVAEGVAQLPGASLFSYAGVLTNYDGMVGTLEFLSRKNDVVSGTVLAERVPVQSHSVEAETGRRAFIADSEDGVTGNLYLTAEPTVGSTAAIKVKKVGEHAHIETARFLEQPRAVAYLARKPGDQYASLRVWLIESELSLTIHDRVSEYRTVPWPAPGILYAVPSGEDAGLWFSKAR